MEILSKKTFTQLFKFGIIGVINTAVNYVVYASLVYVGLHYILAGFAGFVIGVLNSFYWNNKYVFKNKTKSKRDILYSLLKTYVSYAFTGIFLGSLLAIFFIEIMHISPYVSPFCGIFITVPLNFILFKTWAFRERKQKKEIIPS